MHNLITLSSATIIRRTLPHGFPTWEQAAHHHWHANKRQMEASVSTAREAGVTIPILLDTAEDGTPYVLDGVRRVLVAHTLMLDVPIEVVTE